MSDQWSFKPVGKTARGHSEAAMCGDKRPYDTWAEAEDQVVKLIYADAVAGHPERSWGMSAYGCSYCHYWHVGHSAVGNTRHRASAGSQGTDAQ